jgi:hypothetical protein
MTIRASVGPTGGVEAAMQAFKERAPRFNDETPVGGAKSTGPQIYQPLPVYILSYADALYPNKFLEQVSPAEWRYPVTRAAKRRMVHMQTAKDGHAEFVSLSQGMMVDSILDAALAAEKTFSKSEEVFAPGIIIIPSLRITIMWMRGERNSYFAPISIAQSDANEEKGEKRKAPQLDFSRRLEPLIELARSSLPRKRMIPDNSQDGAPIEA